MNFRNIIYWIWGQYLNPVLDINPNSFISKFFSSLFRLFLPISCHFENNSHFGNFTFIVVTSGKNIKKIEVNISIQYKDVDQYRFNIGINAALSQPSWIPWLWKKNSALHFVILNLFLQFQVFPPMCSLVILAEKKSHTDRRTDTWMDRTKTYMPSAC